VHGGSGRQGKRSAIVWNGNLGDLEVGDGWVKVSVSPVSPALFEVGEGSKTTAR
jgi:hypothetical protein